MSITEPLAPTPTVAVMTVSDNIVKLCAFRPPKYTAVVPVNPVPKIFTVPFVPALIGLNELILGIPGNTAILNVAVLPPDKL